MFDFENLDVYKKAKDLNKEVLKFLKENKQIDIYIRDQLKRASIRTRASHKTDSRNARRALGSIFPLAAELGMGISFWY